LLAAPELLRVRNVQHLMTVVTGRTTEAHTVLDHAGRRHPKHAIGGYTRDRALA